MKRRLAKIKKKGSGRKKGPRALCSPRSFDRTIRFFDRIRSFWKSFDFSKTFDGMSNEYELWVRYRGGREWPWFHKKQSIQVSVDSPECARMIRSWFLQRNRCYHLPYWKRSEFIGIPCIYVTVSQVSWFLSLMCFWRSLTDEYNNLISDALARGKRRRVLPV